MILNEDTYSYIKQASNQIEGLICTLVVFIENAGGELEGYNYEAFNKFANAVRELEINAVKEVKQEYETIHASLEQEADRIKASDSSITKLKKELNEIEELFSRLVIHSKNIRVFDSDTSNPYVPDANEEVYQAFSGYRKYLSQYMVSAPDERDTFASLFYSFSETAMSIFERLFSEYDRMLREFGVDVEEKRKHIAYLGDVKKKEGNNETAKAPLGAPKTSAYIRLGIKKKKICSEDREETEEYDNVEDEPEREKATIEQETQERLLAYYAECQEIGKNPDLSPKEKVEAIQDSYEQLGDGNRKDIQCIASEKYLNTEKPFKENGIPNPNYPDHQGFNMEEGREPRPISRENPMQESVDRYGSANGSFVAGMHDGESASFESRSLPNKENPEAYHSYSVDNERYCDAIDMVRNCNPNDIQPTVDSINDMIDEINNSSGTDLEHIDTDDMKDMIGHYNDYLNNLEKDIPEISAEDAPYGLSGEAAPWHAESGELLSEGGADQKWLPLSVDDFEKIGVFKEN